MTGSKHDELELMLSLNYLDTPVESGHTTDTEESGFIVGNSSIAGTFSAKLLGDVQAENLLAEELKCLDVEGNLTVDKPLGLGQRLVFNTTELTGLNLMAVPTFSNCLIYTLTARGFFEGAEESDAPLNFILNGALVMEDQTQARAVGVFSQSITPAITSYNIFEDNPNDPSNVIGKLAQKQLALGSIIRCF
ncbi:hypothetical protein WAK64_21885 [Bacillus spongiae]|uniref:Uncharacterized protein n=1 Tax=Bacillus spongiae TaxID=2683610 RepID=A0ABU8HJU0_9BACI